LLFSPPYQGIVVCNRLDNFVWQKQIIYIMKYGISFFLSVTLVVSAYTQSIEMVKDIMPDSNINPPVFSGSQIEGLTAIDNAVYFKASDGESTNLWTSDGTENGTLKIPYPEEGITVSDMIKYNGDIF